LIWICNVNYRNVCRKKKEFENFMKCLTTERRSISNAMIYCIENADKSEDIIQFISHSIKNEEISLNKKVIHVIFNMCFFF